MLKILTKLLNHVNYEWMSLSFLLSYVFGKIPTLNLQLLLVLPIIAIISTHWTSQKNFEKTVINFSKLIFVGSCTLALNFNYLEVGFQFFYTFTWLPFSNIHLTYGLDGISILFMPLTAFLVLICICMVSNSTKARFRTFVVLLYFTEFFLFQAFSILDLVFFYIFFEGVLIPMFLIIGIWGSRLRKIQAAYQFFLYTFFGSMFMLLSIIYIYNTVGTTDYITILCFNFPYEIQKILWLAFFISFAVKIPMVPFHTWLPEAHVEAPTAGSVLLAGVLLKLGAYGFIRFLITLFPDANSYFLPLVFLLSLISIIYTSLSTIRQIDLKKSIAYSSVAHMNLVVIGLFSLHIAGMEGAILLMLSHGIVSPALFLCVGILYDRYKTRLLSYYGGLSTIMPIFSVLFLIFSIANMGFPGTSAFIGEFLILLGSFNTNSLVSFFASTSVILSAAYSIWLFNRVAFGPVNDFIRSYSDLNKVEFIVLGSITTLVLIFGIFPNTALEYLHTSCSFVLSFSS